MYSIDEHWLKNQSRKITVKIKGISEGEYKVKEYDLNKDHGGIFNDWLRIGNFVELDNETREYLEKIIFPKYLISKMKVEEDVITLKSILTLNACKLYVFEPLY